MKLPIAIIIIVASLIQCSLQRVAGGSGSDVGNGRVTGFVQTADSGSLAKVSVILLPSDYNPVSDDTIVLHNTETNADGSYEFKNIKPGIYNVVASKYVAGTKFMIRNIVSGDDDIALRTETLLACGAIKVRLPDTINTETGFVYIPGTPIKFPVDVSGEAIISGVPSGNYPEIEYCEKGNQISLKPLARSVVVSPGDTSYEQFFTWQNKKSLYLNTEPSGADITGNIVAFPVLIRLTQSNFDFSQAHADGSDIRFSKANGSPLAFEIEQWDVAGQTASVWVKVDTVYGGNSTQFIQMYWGNQRAKNESNGKAVFDTANGFAGVWHLNEVNGDVSDATVNAGTGKNEGTVTGTGAIGNGRIFDRNRISMGANSPLCTMSDSITVSGWIMSTQVPDSTVSVIRHAGNFTALQFNLYHEWTSFWTVDSTGYSPVNFPLWASNFGNGSWHYFTARFKAGLGCFVYKDGMLLAQNLTDTARLKTNTGAFYLGSTEAGGEYYVGSLDEVRIERAYRSDDWIKLCYMNQKSQDALVIFK